MGQCHSFLRLVQSGIHEMAALNKRSGNAGDRKGASSASELARAGR
jgi:hypothetical protein